MKASTYCRRFWKYSNVAYAKGKELERVRDIKMTKFTAITFIFPPNDKIAKSHFECALPAVLSQDPLKKFFGKARQCCGGNFHIDVVHVIVAGKNSTPSSVSIEQYLPVREHQNNDCTVFIQEINESDPDISVYPDIYCQVLELMLLKSCFIPRKR